MQLNKIPATVITGFLGSGKTTLLSRVLQQAAGKRIAVIVNEFGELDIDASLLRSCPPECAGEASAGFAGGNGIYELANGCICCTVEEEFLPVMQQLVERRSDIDHILIETSGLALPKPLVQAFNWPGIKQYFTVDAVITVIDGPAMAAGRHAHDETRLEAQRLADDSLDHDPSLCELLDDQLNAADLVVVSKNDLLGDAERERVEAMVLARVPAAVKTAFVSADDTPLDVLTGIGSAAEERIEQVHNHHDRYHAHDRAHDHAHDHFDSFVLTFGEVDDETLDGSLRTLIEQHPVYRVKGFAALPGKPMRQVVQAVGRRIERHFDRVWHDGEARLTQLVFIGKGIDEPTFKRTLQLAVVTA